MAIDEYGLAVKNFPVAEGTADALRPHLGDKYWYWTWPIIDGWGRPLHVRVTPESYEIWSTGRDGLNGRDSSAFGTNPDSDIIFKNGAFVQYRSDVASSSPWTPDEFPPWHRKPEPASPLAPQTAPTDPGEVVVIRAPVGWTPCGAWP